MISKQAVEEQLKRIGFNFRLWGRAEVNELGRILLEDEIIAECVNGEYANGFALLVATNHRVLLVDKKPMLYLTVEDLRFDMITEFNFSHRLMNATIHFYTPNKTLIFTSWNQGRLRKLLEFTQQRVLEMRQQAHMSSQFQAAAAAQYAQLHAANYYQPQVPNYAPNLVAHQSQEPQAAQAPMQQAQQPQAQPTPQPINHDQYGGPAAGSGNGAGQQGQGMGGDQANLSAALAIAASEPTVGQMAPDTSEQSPVMSRLAAKRSTLGTYTRSKLPSFRRHHDRVDNATPIDLTQATDAQTGEIYPQGYTPGQPVTNFGMPYEY